MIYLMGGLSLFLFVLTAMGKTKAAIIFGGILWAFHLKPLENAIWQGFWRDQSGDRVSCIITAANVMGCLYMFTYFGLGISCLFLPYIGQLFSDMGKYRKTGREPLFVKGCLDLMFILLLLPFMFST